MEECRNCEGTGLCPACDEDDGTAPCSWCEDGSCPDCEGEGHHEEDE